MKQSQPRFHLHRKIFCTLEKLIIAKEARWRIRDGKPIRIFLDHWLLNSVEGRVVSPPNLLSPKASVDTLIDSHTGWWNSHLIDLCFYLLEAQHIKYLPLCSTP